MKRNPSLVPLSHDHQHGLAVALRLRRATAETAGEAKAAFISFWAQEGAHHFRIEEELLLPAASRHLPPTHEAVVRVLVEHVELRRRGADLALAPVPELDDLHALGDRLKEHINHEERVLFPLIEDALPEAERGELAGVLERAEHQR